MPASYSARTNNDKVPGPSKRSAPRTEPDGLSVSDTQAATRIPPTRRQESANPSASCAVGCHVGDLADFEHYLDIRRIASVVGMLAAIPPLIGFSIGMTESWRPAVPPVVFAGIIGVAAVLGMLAFGVPTRVGLRARAVDAIGIRD
jgi:hypothetical protein